MKYCDAQRWWNRVWCPLYLNRQWGTSMLFDEMEQSLLVLRSAPSPFRQWPSENKCGWWEAQGVRAALWTNPRFELGLDPGGWVRENTSLIHLWSAVDIHYYTFLVLSCIKWRVSVDLCQLFLMHNQSICQSQYVSLPIQMLVSSLLFQRFWLVSITFWFDIQEQMGGLGFAGFQGIVWGSRAWMDICHDQSPACKPNSREKACLMLFILCLAFHFLHCVSATGRDRHHWSDSGLISFTWIYWRVFCGLVGRHYARTSKLNVTWHIHSHT